MGKDDNEILNDLIAQRNELNDRIEAYRKSCGELSTTAENTSLKGKSCSFEELVARSIMDNTDIVCTDSYPKNYKLTVINVDNSVHITNNHKQESHINTNVGLGDSMIGMLGNALRNLFE